MGEHDIQIYRAVCNPMANGEPAIRPSTEDDSAEVLEKPEMGRLANLPPLLLTLVLPIEYPMRRPPILKTVHATNDWLPGSMVAPMVRRLQEIWDIDAEGSGVLWRTCDWIRSGEFLTDIGLLQDGLIRCGFWKSCVLSSLRVSQNSSPSPGLASTTPCSPQLIRPR